MNFTLPTLRCKPCGHTWIPRKPQMPKICPVCKRTNYLTGLKDQRLVKP